VKSSQDAIQCGLLSDKVGGQVHVWPQIDEEGLFAFGELDSGNGGVLWIVSNKVLHMNFPFFDVNFFVLA